MSNPRTLLGPALGLAVVLALALAVAAEGSAYRIDGPRQATPGEIITYTVRGASPGRPIAFTFEPARCRARGCRYGDANQAWIPDGDGVARVRVRWPAVEWRPRSLARVRACSVADPRRCAGRLVRIR